MEHDEAHQQELEQQEYEETHMKVYTAIAAVMRDMATEGISKSRKNVQQGYQFRGIDDVYNALSPVMARNGLVMLPRILSRACEERTTAKGGVLFYVTVEAEFDLICAEDGSKHTVRTYGEAMDSADKATNKAMSAAYKYAAMQAFCIPTEGDNDADATTHQITAKSHPGLPSDRAARQDMQPKEAKPISYDEALKALDCVGSHADLAKLQERIEASWKDYTNPQKTDLRQKKQEIVESLNKSEAA